MPVGEPHVKSPYETLAKTLLHDGYPSQNHVLPAWWQDVEVSHTSTPIATYGIAQACLTLPDLPTGEADCTLVLCNSHYQQLYREITFPRPCAACMSQP